MWQTAQLFNYILVLLDNIGEVTWNTHFERTHRRNTVTYIEGIVFNINFKTRY
jgi:hypothetical protein